MTDNVINFTEKRNQKLEEDAWNAFAKHYDTENFTVSFDDLFVDVEDITNFLGEIDTINTFSNTQAGPFMEQIANLIEICGYNIDWNNAPSWHRDMYQRANQFYDDHYNKGK